MEAGDLYSELWCTSSVPLSKLFNQLNHKQSSNRENLDSNSHLHRIAVQIKYDDLCKVPTTLYDT